jgi:hypothetical protein
LVQSSAIKGNKKKRSSDEAFNELTFPNNLQEIQQYSIWVNDTQENPRKYIIEVHRYVGFAMVKYFPFCLKKNPKKYELRGEKIIGYRLHPTTVLKIIYECALIMRDYLDANQDEFVGYIGQIDSKDNKRKRKYSQRCSVYNTLTSSIFNDSKKYKISSKKKFAEINLRLIRLQKSKQNGRLTKKQMQNYNSFLDLFSQEPKRIYELMTDVTKEKVKNDFDANNSERTY